MTYGPNFADLFRRAAAYVDKMLKGQGWDLQLTQYGDGNWRATFYVTGAAHSIVGGSAWEPTAWGAVQRAASAAVTHESGAAA